MAFKKGDKAVYKPCGRSRNENNVYPKDGETITLAEFEPAFGGSWEIKKYPRAKDGRIQCFSECCLRPLQTQYHSVGISKELAKSFTETLETSEIIKTEKEKAI